MYYITFLLIMCIVVLIVAFINVLHLFIFNTCMQCFMYFASLCVHTKQNMSINIHRFDSIHILCYIATADCCWSLHFPIGNLSSGNKSFETHYYTRSYTFTMWQHLQIRLQQQRLEQRWLIEARWGDFSMATTVLIHLSGASIHL